LLPCLYRALYTDLFLNRTDIAVKHHGRIVQAGKPIGAAALMARNHTTAVPELTPRQPSLRFREALRSACNSRFAAYNSTRRL
jgi:hypothetical protein